MEVKFLCFVIFTVYLSSNGQGFSWGNSLDQVNDSKPSESYVLQRHHGNRQLKTARIMATINSASTSQPEPIEEENEFQNGATSPQKGNTVDLATMVKNVMKNKWTAKKMTYLPQHMLPPTLMHNGRRYGGGGVRNMGYTNVGGYGGDGGGNDGGQGYGNDGGQGYGNDGGQGYGNDGGQGYGDYGDGYNNGYQGNVYEDGGGYDGGDEYMGEDVPGGDYEENDGYNGIEQGVGYGGNGGSDGEEYYKGGSGNSGGYGGTGGNAGGLGATEGNVYKGGPGGNDGNTGYVSGGPGGSNGVSGQYTAGNVGDIHNNQIGTGPAQYNDGGGLSNVGSYKKNYDTLFREFVLNYFVKKYHLKTELPP